MVQGHAASVEITDNMGTGSQGRDLASLGTECKGWTPMDSVGACSQDRDRASMGTLAE